GFGHANQNLLAASTGLVQLPIAPGLGAHGSARTCRKHRRATQGGEQLSSCQRHESTPTRLEVLTGSERIAVTMVLPAPVTAVTAGSPTPPESSYSASVSRLAADRANCSRAGKTMPSARRICRSGSRSSTFVTRTTFGCDPSKLETNVAVP